MLVPTVVGIGSGTRGLYILRVLMRMRGGVDILGWLLRLMRLGRESELGLSARWVNDLMTL